MKIGIEIPEELVYMIDGQAKTDGHDSRSAVIQKALIFFFAEKVAFVTQDCLERKIIRDRPCQPRINPVPGISKMREVNRIQNVAKISAPLTGEK